jgi:hypothetical protein
MARSNITWTFLVLALVLVGAAGCGGSNDTGSSSDGNTATTVYIDTSGPGSDPIANVSAACASAMEAFAGTNDMSDAEMQPYLDATLTACTTAAEWDTAANKWRDSDGSATDYVIEGPKVTADQVRKNLCLGETSTPPACSGG